MVIRRNDAYEEWLHLVNIADAIKSLALAVQELTGDDLVDALAGVERDMLLLAYPAVASEFTVQADEPKEGLVRIEVRGPSESAFELFLREDSALPARIVYPGKHPMTGATAEFEESYEDFREVDGLRRPHRIVTRIDGSVFAEATVTRIVVNPEIAADRFSRSSS